jgi:hypothetical protein
MVIITHNGLIFAPSRQLILKEKDCSKPIELYFRRVWPISLENIKK